MTVRIGDFEFTNVRYDAEGDVLYLSVGHPRPAADSHMTPEMHLWRFDEAGGVIGLTIVGPKRILDREGVIMIAAPSHSLTIGADAVSPALANAC